MQARIDICKSIHGSVASVVGAGISLVFLTTSLTSLTVMCLDESEKMLLELKLQAIRSFNLDNVYNYWGFIQDVVFCIPSITSLLQKSKAMVGPA